MRDRTQGRIARGLSLLGGNEAQGITWTPMTLDAYIADPQGYIKYNRMAFYGIQRSR